MMGIILMDLYSIYWILKISVLIFEHISSHQEAVKGNEKHKRVQPKNGRDKMKSLRHPVFPGGHPSKY